MGDLKNAEQLFLKARSLDPGSNDIIYSLYSLYEVTKEYDKALDILKEGNQGSVIIMDAIAETYTLKKDYPSAIRYYEKYEAVEKSFEDTTQSVPLRHRLAFVYAQVGRKKEADQLMREQLQILDDIVSGKRGIGVWNSIGAAYYDRALCLAYFEKRKEAVASITTAFDHGWRNDYYYHNDRLLGNLQDYQPFHNFLKKANDFRDFQRAAFVAAFNRAKANKELKGILDK